MFFFSIWEFIFKQNFIVITNARDISGFNSRTGVGAFLGILIPSLYMS